MTKKVVHYINQFYAGIGGETEASIGLSVKDGPVGPGLALKAALGDEYEIVKTIICGDNTIAEKAEVILPQIVQAVKDAGADLFVAGPGFNAGRYGLGCGSATAAVTEQLRIPAVTALYSENPGTDLYKNRCYILQTSNNAHQMAEVLKQIAEFAKRLVSGDAIRDGKEEHYHGSGPAVVIDYSTPAAVRGIDMLLAKVAGKPYHTEVIMPNHEQIPVPTLNKPLSECRIAVVTDGGLVPKGNPDGQVPTNSKAFKEYSVAGMDSLQAKDWEVSHQGYNNAFVLADPNRLVPIDALRRLAKAGVIGSVNDTIFSTAGVMTPMEKCKSFGEGIAELLKKEGVDAVIETST
ncbi:glycine/betaine/sarcosine/D-proline family reductase selenoprotein B [Pyramidobacter sp. YE332]|uniref:glycine/betaine/sarcosine/D-proline family reductase selenoprotein B n=1 Tax=Pyramidobacter sp. YE332 TaxID=3068894 RepID=UPI00294B07BE|nr:glycine/betaine/sarcosine/D-proline family reductase selenoprotein B [Pyramidobacter sp. YE332]WOL39930.1 glycine/betaine/sarcosine/D-proline family reductase selenoprotein B [Pyramidobacter sp. YE332]